MKLSDKAWEQASCVIDAIFTHAFNQELMKGSLAKDKFAYYIEQDSLYLKDFARSLAIIASKAPAEYVRLFLQYSSDTCVAEEEIVHQYFKSLYNFKETGLVSPAMLSYTSYLLRICTIETVEIGIAAILPCFWVYREVGLYIAKHSQANNPYARWIETYAGEAFGASVDQVIDIFDNLANKASEITKQKMLDAFYKSSCLEWHFWNDAYNKAAIDNVKP